nr:hypothetical protein BgiMline_016534 [Biomphalaria glabrata]
MQMRNFAQVMSFGAQVMSFGAQVISFGAQVISFGAQVISSKPAASLSLLPLGKEKKRSREGVSRIE